MISGFFGGTGALIAVSAIGRKSGAQINPAVTMVSLLVVFLGFREIRPFTSAIFPILYSNLVPNGAVISGTSKNPARSLGPAVISGVWQGWWIYWAEPIRGALLALACSALAKRITVAKIYHFDSDCDGLFRKKGVSDLEIGENPLLQKN